MIAIAVACSVSACTSEAPPVNDVGGLVTAMDSTTDTIVARVSGVVPEAAIKRLVTEMRIAPGADNTSLFTDINGFEVDRRGFVWVFDYPTRSMFLFDSAGNLSRHIGRRGAGPGEFRTNRSMVVLADGRMAQYDWENARISFFSPAGDLVTSWSIDRSRGDLVTDDAGRIYSIEAMWPPSTRNDRVRAGDPPSSLVRVTEGGGIGDTVHPPRYDVLSYTYVASQVTATRARTVASSASHTPSALWALHPDGFFVAGDGSKYHVLIARPARKPVRIERAAPPVAIPADERSSDEKDIYESMRQVDPSWSWSGPPLPETKAPLIQLLISRDGRIWAEVPAPSERVPPDEIVLSPDWRGPPPVRFRSPQIWEVYSPNGEFLGRVPLPRRARLIHADGNRIWYLERDADDLPAIVRARIEPALPNR